MKANTCDAVKNKNLLEFYYDGGIRIVERIDKNHYKELEEIVDTN